MNEELTNLDVVLYSLYSLGGTKSKIFTEDIAKKCFDLMPTRFSWRKYPQFPDVEPTRKILIAVRDGKGLITGRAGEVKGLKPSDGWIFTPAGVDWINENLKRIEELLKITSGKPKNPRTLSEKIWFEREKSSAYKKFLRDGSCEQIKDYEFTDFLDANLDTPPQILRERMDELSVQAAGAKKEQILKYLEECKQKFAVLLGYENKN